VVSATGPCSTSSEMSPMATSVLPASASITSAGGGGSGRGRSGRRVGGCEFARRGGHTLQSRFAV
jgi:hypothetical protein